jgi:cold shock CspA family protein
MKGTIRNIRDDKDYAFIVSGANRDIFLHKRSFQGNWDALRELWRLGPVTVEFEVSESPKGLRADKCRLVNND